MWRWLHSLPRAVRQQFQSPRASAGVYEEDKHDFGFGGQGRRDSGSECGNNSWRSHCRCSGQTNGKEGGEKEGPHPERVDFWGMVNGPHSALEAIGWGGAIALGIQVGHYKLIQKRLRTLDDYSSHCLLYRIAYALPTLTPSYSTASSITGSKASTDKQENKGPPTIETLEKAFENFEKVCQKYTATGKGMMGMQQANAGNMESAMALWVEASSLGYAKSQFNLGVCFEVGRGVKKDLKTAMAYYKLAAVEDHPQALFNLGLLYMQGSTTTPTDVAKAERYIERAADVGLIEAQRYLSIYYMEDETQNAEKSVRYLTMAADQQDVECQYVLGLMYEDGCVVEGNMGQAAQLYTRASANGHIGATFKLARFHSQGLGGLPVDKQCARTLLQRAAECRYPEAQAELDKLLAEDKQSQSHGQAPQDGGRKGQSGLLLKINTSVSSPSLTEFVCRNISKVGVNILQDPVSQSGTLSQIFTQLMIPRGHTVAPTLTEIPSLSSSPSGSDSDSGVVFSIGGDEDEEDCVKTCGGYTGPDMQICEQAPCATLPRRTSTMPDLQTVAT